MGFTVYVLFKKKIAQIASQADCVILSRIPSVKWLSTMQIDNRGRDGAGIPARAAPAATNGARLQDLRLLPDRPTGRSTADLKDSWHTNRRNLACQFTGVWYTTIQNSLQRSIITHIAKNSHHAHKLVSHGCRSRML
jgi:hypothetical protein